MAFVPPVKRDSRTVDLLEDARSLCARAQVALQHLPVKPAASAAARSLPPALRDLGVAAYTDAAISGAAEVALQRASMCLLGALSRGKEDRADQALKEARAKIDDAAKRLDAAKNAKVFDARTVTDVATLARMAATSISGVQREIQVVDPSSTPIACNKVNANTGIPVSFCIIQTKPGERFDEELKTIQNLKPAGAEKSADTPTGAPEPTNPLPQLSPTANSPIDKERELEKIEAAEIEAREKSTKAAEAAAGGPKETWPVWWEMFPNESEFREHKDYLVYQQIVPVMNADFLLFRGKDKQHPQEVLVGRTDENGRLHWENGQEAFLPPGETFWCFWTYDRKHWLDRARELKDSSGFNAAREYGLFKFVTKPDVLHSATRVRGRVGDPKAPPTPEEDLAFHFFSPDTCPLDSDLFARMLLPLLFSLKDGRGYLTSYALTGVSRVGYDRDPMQFRDSCWVLAHRPAISCIQVVEFLARYLRDVRSWTAEARSTISQMALFVETSKQAAETGQRMHEWDLDAMQSLTFHSFTPAGTKAYGTSVEAPAPAPRARPGRPTPLSRTDYDEKNTYAIRWRMRRYYDELIEYVRKCALATRDSSARTRAQVGAAVPKGPEPVGDLELVATKEIRAALADPEHCLEARERIEREFGVPFPKPPPQYDEWYRLYFKKPLADYFTLYQYHRRIESSRKWTTKNTSQWYTRHREIEAELEFQIESMLDNARSLMKKYAPVPAVFADIAWHVAPDPNAPPPSAPVNYSSPQGQMHLRYIWTSVDVQHQVWHGAPEPESEEAKAKGPELIEVAKTAFEKAGKANEYWTKALEMRTEHFSQIVAKDFRAAFVGADGVNKLIGGETVPSKVKDIFLHFETRDGKGVLTVIRDTGKSKEVIAKVRFKSQSIHLGTMGRVAQLDHGGTTIPLAKTRELQYLEKKHKQALTGIPTFFSKFFNIAVAAIGIIEFQKGEKDGKAVWELVGNLAAVVTNLGEAMELVRCTRLMGRTFTKYIKPVNAAIEGVGKVTAVYEAITLVREGALTVWAEGGSAEFRGDEAGMYICRTKGVFVMFAGGYTGANAVAVALGFSALPGVGWVVAGVAVLGVVAHVAHSFFSEPDTFLTEREDRLGTAVAREYENRRSFAEEHRYDHFYMSRANTYVWRAVAVSRALARNERYLLLPEPKDQRPKEQHPQDPAPQGQASN